MSYTDEKWIRDGVEVRVPKKFRKYGGEIFKECLSHCIIAPSSTLIHKKLLKSVGVFDENLEVCEDYDLWLRVAKNHKIGLIDKKLITKHAGHEDQLSFKHWGMDRFRVKALEKLLRSNLDNKMLDLKNELIKKYTLLLKGAVKHDKLFDIQIYEERLRELERFLKSK